MGGRNSGGREMGGVRGRTYWPTHIGSLMNDATAAATHYNISCSFGVSSARGS